MTLTPSQNTPVKVDHKTRNKLHQAYRDSQLFAIQKSPPKKPCSKRTLWTVSEIKKNVQQIMIDFIDGSQKNYLYVVRGLLQEGTNALP